MEIDRDQFLITKPKELGIKILRYLQIKNQDLETGNSKKDSPTYPSLEVRISGEAESLEVGLGKELTVDSIQVNILESMFGFPHDAIIALIGFCSASFSYMLYLFIDKFEWHKPK